jgi:formyl-CoA transferase/CoA:oxalate CoA-transferase
MARLGPDFDTLSRINPRLIYCSVSAFGQTGPWSGRSAFDIAIQALSGAISVTGERGRPPVRMGFPMADLSGGLFATIAILAAVAERSRTGEGQYIDVSLLDSMVSLLGYLAGRVVMTGEDPWPVGAGHHSIVPYGAYQASDGYLIIATLTETFWPKLCSALGIPELAANPKYKTNEQRVAARQAVDAAIQSVVATRSVDEWCKVLENADVPHAPVLKVSDVLKHPQVLARDMVTVTEHTRLGPLTVVGGPPRFSSKSSRRRGHSPPPLLGEHTVQVLRDVLQYSPAEIAALIEQGVVSEPSVGVG